MRVTLVRHGQSQNNANRERQRQHDPELTKLGHEQARILGEWFATAQDIEEISDMDAHDPDRMTPARARITRIYVSPMRRALQTAKHLQDALNVPTLVWTDIHESGGLYVHTPEGVRGFPGLTREKMQHDFPKYTLPDTVTQHGWYDPSRGEEDVFGCYARATRVASSLRSQGGDAANRSEHVLLVSHGIFINALIHALLDNLPSEHTYHMMYNTGLTRFDFVDDRMMLVRYVNRIMHLPPHQVT
ncbi:MAG: histidine phosphatase family protein [Anaerolineae bacterium]|nr:histidine phosphatase family protein [Chloroflexota bacterium]MCO6445042.1 histidine phosphatase family protein [Anaerolineae bacterium]MDL1914584.1 histidine phosphatase family protein [Anaerolineae bacterium CFX4]OQY85845.1 MAG: hypothetical protein B6D42_02675 [Anaerolineae bacterium UTCFX5]NOG50067.1 histidine phosphatase family protein [Chloroflexota bacterium]